MMKIEVHCSKEISQESKDRQIKSYDDKIAFYEKIRDSLKFSKMEDI